MKVLIHHTWTHEPPMFDNLQFEKHGCRQFPKQSLGQGSTFLLTYCCMQGLILFFLFLPVFENFYKLRQSKTLAHHLGLAPSS